VTFQNITATQMAQSWGISVTGAVVNSTTYSPENITFSNFTLVAKGGVSPIPTDPPEYPYDTGQYPDPQVWGNLPAYGFYLRHVTNAQFSSITASVASTDARPLFKATSDVTGSGF
jgi:hypothetical protein